jgi:hypothetical protein
LGAIGLSPTEGAVADVLKVDSFGSILLAETLSIGVLPFPPRTAISPMHRTRRVIMFH